MRTLHIKLPYFGGEIISNISLNSIEPHSFGDHVSTSLATNVKRCLVTDGFAFDDLSLFVVEDFQLLGLALLEGNELWVVIFAYVEVIGSCCS